MRHFRIRLYLRARDGLAKAVAQRLPQKNGNARPLRPRPRAGRESIDADQLMGVKSAASATGAVDRAPPAFDVKATDLSFCAAPKDADGTYVKRDPIIVWQSAVAFAPRGPQGAERWPYSLAITPKVAPDWTNCFELIG